MPVSCSRKSKRSLRARTGSGNMPSGKQSSRPNKRTRHNKGWNICIGAFDVPDRRKIPEAAIIMKTRKGVALSYAPERLAV